MHRIHLAIAASLVSGAAFAGALDVTAPATLQTLSAMTPAAQKVYPPLPTLAMLPPSINDEDDVAAPRSSAKKGKKARRVVADCKCNAPEPRLVVSDDSNAYLNDVDARLDAALAAALAR